MPNNAYSDVVTDAEGLLTASGANPSFLPSVERHRPQVEAVLGEIKTLKAAQKALTADKQKMTQDLQDALKRLKELVIFLRAAIRGDIGPRTEKLVEYGIAPLRKRGRRASPVDPDALKKSQ